MDSRDTAATQNQIQKAALPPSQHTGNGCCQHSELSALNAVISFPVFTWFVASVRLFTPGLFMCFFSDWIAIYLLKQFHLHLAT